MVVNGSEQRTASLLEHTHLMEKNCFQWTSGAYTPELELALVMLRRLGEVENGLLLNQENSLILKLG